MPHPKYLTLYLISVVKDCSLVIIDLKGNPAEEGKKDCRTQ